MPQGEGLYRVEFSTLEAGPRQFSVAVAATHSGPIARLPDAAEHSFQAMSFGPKTTPASAVAPTLPRCPRQSGASDSCLHRTPEKRNQGFSPNVWPTPPSSPQCPQGLASIPRSPAGSILPDGPNGRIPRHGRARSFSQSWLLLHHMNTDRVFFKNLHGAIKIPDSVSVPLFLQSEGYQKCSWDSRRKRPDESDLKTLELPQCPSPPSFQLLETVTVFDPADLSKRAEHRKHLGSIPFVQA